MNPKDRNKYILLAVLGLVAVGVVIYQITRPPAIPEMPPRPDGQPRTAAPAAPAPSSPAAAPGQSAFVQADVDIEQLLASVQEVDFDYQLERQARNPMTPIHRTRAGEVIDTTAGRADTSPALAIARGMIITGIMYDPAEPIAVLENRADQQVELVTVGHSFPIGIVVESIDESSVVLRVGDMRIPKMLEEQQ